MATPVGVFAVEVDQVRKQKAHGFPQPWLRFWRSCTFEIIDSYDTEDTPGPPLLFEGYGGY
jgi:hypothetical protein